jgi:phenylalanyl-tRNA synthetase beta subunit
VEQHAVPVQVTLDTRDILIECTATDLGKARTVLATMCAMFCEHAAVPFEVEPVEVIDAAGVRHGAQPRLCHGRLEAGWMMG